VSELAPDTQALAALLARVESETGEDRELDAASHVAMCEPKQYPDDHRRFRLPHPSLDHMDMCAAGTYWLVERSGRSLQTSPRYTSSIDARALLAALIKAKMEEQ